MITFYQRRATGKSTQLVGYSHLTGFPIAALSQAHIDHLQWTADEVLHVTIPPPFIATPKRCREAGKYLVDEAGLLLQNLLGGEIAIMTVTDQGCEEELFEKLGGVV